MSKIFYLLIRGNVECNHEDDEWLGIYDSVEKLYSAYKRAVQGLEEERRAYEEKFGESVDSWTLQNEKILINSFDEYSGEWKHGIAPEEIFGDIVQSMNDEILDSEVKISEFEKRNDKEKIIESVIMGETLYENANEFANKLIELTIQFDRAMEEPQILKKMEEEQKFMESIDLRKMLEDDNTTI